MLIETRVYGFSPLKDLTLIEVKNNFAFDFYSNLYNLMSKQKASGLGNYRNFEKFSKRITFNNKNVVYCELHTDIKEFRPPLGNEVANTSFEEQRQHTENEEFCYKNCLEYFGKGEFPFMEITIVRIGNNDYCFYTITR